MLTGPVLVTKPAAELTSSWGPSPWVPAAPQLRGSARARAQLRRSSAARSASAATAELATATPADDAALEAGIRALAKILGDTRSKLPADAQAKQRLAEVDGLRGGLQALSGTVHTSKGQTIADTARIDLYDGKLYVWIRDLNRAAQRAIRNGHLAADLHEYTLHHLKHSGNLASPPPAPPAPSPPAAQ